MNEQASYKENLSLKSEFNIRTILDVLFSKWYWFLLSVSASLICAYLYVQTIPTVHKRTAVVMLKEQSRAEDAFIEKQLFSQNGNVNNEILIFKSQTLMAEVVKRLELDRQYIMDSGLKKHVLFLDSPIRIAYTDSALSQALSFTIIPLSTTTFRVTGLPDDPDDVLEEEFGKVIETPGGRLIVEKSGQHSDKWIGISIQVSCTGLEAAIASCLGGLEVERAVSDATLLALKYQDTNPDRADAILNTLIEVYNDEAMRDKNLVIRNTASFIDERLELINSELGIVDSDIESFKKKNSLTNIASEAGIYLNNKSRYEDEGVALSNQIELAKMIQEYLRDPLKGGQLLPTNSGIMDTGVEGMINEYNRNLLVYNKLKKNASDRSPVVEELGVSLVALRNTIVKILDNLQRGLNLKLEDARRQQMRASSRISTVPTQEKYMLNVERQQKIKEELYLYLLNKREENALSMATAESNVRVIDPAFGTGTAGANQMVILLGAFFAGLAIPSLFFYIQPMLDATVRGRKDLEDALTIPYLGEIPHNRKAKETIVVHDKGRDGVSEAFRIVRSNLSFMLRKKEGAQVIMFTSSNPAAGKSFVSYNLAVSLALTGKRSILLEMDIRKGSQREDGKGVMPGLTNYLSGNTNQIEELIQPGRYHSMLDVIPSGPIPPNPAELLLSSRLDELIDLLKDKYEYILIDAVPYGMVADARIICRVSDLNVYVIREGRMDRRQLPEVEKLYTEGKLANMAILLNDACYKHAGYGYGYGYYGYGYGSSYYGYHSDKKK